MSISERTAKIIWGQCAARCCLCKKDVLYEGEGSVSSLIGEIAHIVGESTRAARGISTLSLEERNDIDNLLLLCRDHHKIVDDDPQSYPVERLHRIKEEHIAWIAASLIRPRSWRSNISQLTYINVPRLSEQAELRGFRVDLSRYRDSETLHNLGWDLNHVMSAFRTVLAQLSIDIVPLEGIALHEGFVGAAIAFDGQRFRTTNIPTNVDARISDFAGFSGELSRDPHIYCQINGFRVVLFIDPRWITTSTAFTLFRPSSGQSFFSGLGRISGVDYEAGIVTVTPWVIGLPKSPFEIAMEEVRGASNNALVGTSALDALDSLVDLARGREEGVYFSPPPTHCDLCRRTLSTEKYMIDGEAKNLRGAWACMCPSCFMEHGRKIAWGYGQLYMRDIEGWLEVAGFAPKSNNKDAF